MNGLPEHFRFRISCQDCSASLEADGHSTMSCLDAWLSGHMDAFGHNEYHLEIFPPLIPLNEGNPLIRVRQGTTALP